jgi:hypothetical protein
MRYPVRVYATALALTVFGAGTVMAQTAPSTPLSKRAQIRQDSVECAKQVDRKRMDLFADCVGKRQDERKAAAKQKKAEESVKRAGCKKQAADQKLHFTARLRFIDQCMGK